MDILTLILGLFTAASVLATVSASFYGVRQKTIIQTLRESNSAYKERNEQLETSLSSLEKEVIILKDRMKVLEQIKTPSIEPLIKLIEQNETQSQHRHDELMAMMPRRRTKK